MRGHNKHSSWRCGVYFIRAENSVPANSQIDETTSAKRTGRMHASVAHNPWLPQSRPRCLNPGPETKLWKICMPGETLGLKSRGKSELRGQLKIAHSRVPGATGERSELGNSTSGSSFRSQNHTQ